jgi:5-hydroxyisourate hydrolase
MRLSAPWRRDATGGMEMAGFLTTHVLDTARGVPAAGVRIVLHRLTGAGRAAVAEAVTNADGRTDAPFLPAAAFAPGTYELTFFAGDYLRATGQAGPAPLFLDVVPIRFGMAEDAHYHVPLLLSPYGYSTYRGS